MSWHHASGELPRVALMEWPEDRRNRQQEPTAGTDSRNRQQTRFGQNAETPLKDVSSSGAIISDSWAWVELNYRPHAYQAASYEHELGSEVLTSLPFTNILLSIPCI